jgi:hypothetical protein
VWARPGRIPDPAGQPRDIADFAEQKSGRIA